MEKIASFQVDHEKLKPGLYLSRRDGDVTTFDLRFKKPNTGDLLSNAEMHSVEHVMATLLRNGPHRDAVVYFGPMGCQTGFYFLFDSGKLTDSQAVAGRFENDQAQHQHHRQHPGIVGQHAREGPQQEKRQLGHAAEPVNPGILFFIRQQSARHGLSPAFHNG